MMVAIRKAVWLFLKTHHLISLWAVLTVAIFTSVAIENFAMKVEGSHFPVVTRAEITRMERIDQNTTRVWLTTHKLRDCEYVDIEWRLGDLPPDPSIQIPVHFEEGHVIRSEGPLELGPWAIDLPAAVLENESHAYVTHQCHVFWNTRSLFYYPDD